LLLSASESAAAPASPIRLLVRLQRGKEGQEFSWRDRAAGTEKGVRNSLDRRQQAQCICKLVTIPPAFELLKHNCFGLHLFAAPNAASSVRLLKSFSLDRRRSYQRRFTRSSLFFPCVCARACFLRPGRDAHTPIARCVLGVQVLLATPTRLPAPDRQPARVAGPWNLPARAPSSRSTPRPAHCFGRPPPLAAARTAFGLLALSTPHTKLAAGPIRDSAVLRASWAATAGRPPRSTTVRRLRLQPYLQSVAEPVGLSTHRHRSAVPPRLSLFPCSPCACSPVLLLSRSASP
jgi:hypothetical protein